MQLRTGQDPATAAPAGLELRLRPVVLGWDGVLDTLGTDGALTRPSSGTVVCRCNLRAARTLETMLRTEQQQRQHMWQGGSLASDGQLTTSLQQGGAAVLGSAGWDWIGRDVIVAVPASDVSLQQPSVEHRLMHGVLLRIRPGSPALAPTGGVVMGGPQAGPAGSGSAAATADFRVWDEAPGIPRELPGLPCSKAWLLEEACRVGALDDALRQGAFAQLSPVAVNLMPARWIKPAQGSIFWASCRPGCTPSAVLGVPPVVLSAGQEDSGGDDGGLGVRGSQRRRRLARGLEVGGPATTAAAAAAPGAVKPGAPPCLVHVAVPAAAGMAPASASRLRLSKSRSRTAHLAEPSVGASSLGRTRSYTATEPSQAAAPPGDAGGTDPHGRGLPLRELQAARPGGSSNGKALTPSPLPITAAASLLPAPAFLTVRLPFLPLTVLAHHTGDEALRSALHAEDPWEDLARQWAAHPDPGIPVRLKPKLALDAVVTSAPKPPWRPRLPGHALGLADVARTLVEALLAGDGPKQLAMRLSALTGAAAGGGGSNVPQHRDEAAALLTGFLGAFGGIAAHRVALVQAVMQSR